METENKRVRRTPQQLAADIDLQVEKLESSIPAIEEKKQAAVAVFDQKIDSVRNKIQALLARKEALLTPRPARKPRRTKKQKIASILKQAQKSGLKPEEIAERLGVDMTEQSL